MFANLFNARARPFLPSRVHSLYCVSYTNYTHNALFTFPNFATARPVKYLLSTYDAPDIVLGTGDVTVNKTDLVPVPMSRT